MSPDPGRPTLPALDRRRMDEISDGDSAFLRELAALFLADAEPSVRAILALGALGAGGDAADARRAAHKLAGSAASLGAPALAARAAAVESLATTAAAEERARALADFAREWEATSAALRREIGARADPTAPPTPTPSPSPNPPDEAKMERCVCIHGHFYQPPRENAWLEEIEVQDSAYPFHDWNERICAECYATNARSRILDAEDRIVAIVNNYARISFNFGPTLLSWLAAKRPDVLERIVEADRESRERFSGHGSALAQVYHHVILPLANRPDKTTQVVWGIRDFEARFGRAPEGMWLAETAADTETLEVLAENGVRFTILSPYQAARFRPFGDAEWTETPDGSIDPSRAYRRVLPSGRSIDLFFYDAHVSRAVAFERLLHRGENLADRLVSAFSDDRAGAQLVHIATDGESYGHHHRHGEMALSYAIRSIEERGLARVTNYGEFLESHPPAHEVEIHEMSSWSCAHGVERWRSDCGCDSGGRPEWHQKWRGPLREALDGLRDGLIPLYEREAAALVSDPWACRNAYIDVLLAGSPDAWPPFAGRWGRRTLHEPDRIRLRKLLELQRHAMMMYTSCGWFFDEISGIETVQILEYAARALQLARELFGAEADPVERRFLEALALAPSNVPEIGNGRVLFETRIRPAAVDLLKVGAHFAVGSLFESREPKGRVFSYDIETDELRTFEFGRSRLVVGRGSFASTRTGEAARLSFAAVHMGDHNIAAGVREFLGEEAWRVLVEDGSRAFLRADFAELVRVLDRHFGAATFSIRSLFRDEQRRTIERLLRRSLDEAEATYRELCERHSPLMRYVVDLGMPQPAQFDVAARFVLNLNLRRAVEADPPDIARARALLEDARERKTALDAPALGLAFARALERLAERLADAPRDPAPLRALADAAGLLAALPFEVDLWRTQNVCFDLRETEWPRMRARAGDDASAREWTEHFATLCRRLRIAIG